MDRQSRIRILVAFLLLTPSGIFTAAAQDRSGSNGDQGFDRDVRGAVVKARQVRVDRQRQELSDQLDRLERSFHYDRTLALAEILHKDKQYRSDQFDPIVQERERQERVLRGQTDAKTLENEFLTEHPGGSRYEAQQLLESSFNTRENSLVAARNELERPGAANSSGDPKELERRHREAAREVTIAYMEGERYHLLHIGKAISGPGVEGSLKQIDDAALKTRLMEQRARLVARISALLDKSQSDVAASEVAAVQSDASTFVVGLGLLNSSQDHDTWAVKVVDAFGIRRQRKETLEQDRALAVGAGQFLSSGDYFGARKRLLDLIGPERSHAQGVKDQGIFSEVIELMRALQAADDQRGGTVGGATIGVGAYSQSISGPVAPGPIQKSK